jgi:hypothetical protein
MKYELKRIPVFPVIKVTFLVSLVLGFAIGLMAAVFIVPLVAFLSQVASAGDGFPSTDLPTGMLVVFLPIFLSVTQAVINTIMALIAVGAYNVIVKFAGGIELELESTDQGLPAPPQPVYYAQASPSPYAVPPSRPAPPPPPPPVPPNNPEADKNRPTQFPYE